MKKYSLLLAIIWTISLLSGCAVIDFLDGKHYDHPTDYSRPSHDSGSYGGGHSH